MAGSRLTDRRLPLLAICGFALVLGLWNAARYPTFGGYDAVAHMAYANGLFPGLHLPQRGTVLGGEYYTPPGFYFAAGIADWILKQAGYGDPDRAGQVLNALFFVGTVLLVAAIARALWPGRRRIELGVGCVHRVPAGCRHDLGDVPPGADVAVSLDARSVALRPDVLRPALRVGARGDARLRAARARVRALDGRRGLPWAVARPALPAARDRARARGADPGAVVHPSAGQVRGQPEFPQPTSTQSLGPSFYLDPGIPGLITQPFREHHYALALPTSYDGVWGDYWGFWAWHAGSDNGAVKKPSASARHRLQLQAVVGLVPTLLALVGWVLFARESWRRREGLAVALLAPLAIAGYLYFAVVYWTSDGDLLKTTYMLTAASAWAIGFGYALDRLRGRLWRVTLVLLVAVRAARAAVPLLLRREHVLEEAVEPGPRCPAELGLDASWVRRRSPSGRTGG